MMFWFLVSAVGIAWVVQSLLSFRQTKAFTELFIELRHKGRVAMGKFSGGFAAGAIVLFVLDDDDRILEGHRLGGVTVLARFVDFDHFNGRFMTMVEPEQVARLGRSTVRAVANAVENYRVVADGGTPAEPPTALGRMLDRLPGIPSRQRSRSDPLGSVGPAPRQRRVVRRGALSGSDQVEPRGPAHRSDSGGGRKPPTAVAKSASPHIPRQSQQRKERS